MEKYISISIIGAGTWGISIADLLVKNGLSVDLYHYNESTLKSIIETRCIPNLNLKLSPSIRLFKLSDYTDSDYDYVFISIPCQYIESVLSKINISKDALIISLSKGISMDSLKYPREIISDSTGVNKDDIVLLSGPSHAEELVVEVPTAIVASSKNMDNAAKVQKLTSNHFFRVYINDDPCGVEIASSIKNIVAIGGGICKGLDFGDNTLAALVTRGLNEIVEFGIDSGAKRETFYGLGGLGDLVATVTSRHSRNYRFGLNIAKRKKSPYEIIKDSNMVVEGYYTCNSIHKMSSPSSMPIINEMYDIMYENKNPSDAITSLMTRELTAESD